MDDKGSKRKNMIKNIAIVFLAVMLVLTFFSNTIMNYSLPEVATTYVTSGTVSSKIRGSGLVEAASDYEVKLSGTRVIKTVEVKVGDEVEEGDLLFTLEEADSEELKAARDQLEELQLSYQKALISNASDVEVGNLAVSTAVTNLNNAQAAYDAQKEKVDNIQKQIDNFGEVADISTLSAGVTEQERNLVTLENELTDLKADYDSAFAMGEDTTELERAIRDKEIQIANAKTDLDSARATLEIMRTSADSYNALKNSLAAETTTLENCEANLKAAEDKLSALSNNLDLNALKADIAKQQEEVNKLMEEEAGTEVYAKTSGIIGAINCVAGDTVTGDTAIATIHLVEKGYTVSLTVTKAQSKLVKVGDEASIQNLWNSDATATLDSIKVDPDNPNTNMILNFVITGDVSVGQNIGLSVGEKSANYDLVVPNSAIREDNNGKFVLVVDVKSTPLGNRYVLTRVGVEVLASDDTNSAVSGGLMGYESVVTTSTKPLEAGMNVRLADE